MWAFLLRQIQLNKLSSVRIVQAAVADVLGLNSMSVNCNSYQNRLCEEEQTPLLVPTITLDAFRGKAA